MPDYGHELEFGTFITPQNQRPQDVVALAQLTERAGPRPRDVPGPPVPGRRSSTPGRCCRGSPRRPTTLRVAPNVLNLPLRQPAVLARAAASLDLLSGGRVELGLGAGAFWDAIEAMGGPQPHARAGGRRAERGDRRHPRHLGRRRARRRARRGASTTTSRGAKRGPEPAHDIGDLARRLQAAHAAADRPQGRRLAAVAGLPAARGHRRRATRAIDEAALAAGRDPREIRRLLNIGARRRRRCEQLLPLVLEHGFSTFILVRRRPARDRALRARRSRPRCARRSRASAAPPARPPGRSAAPRRWRCARDGHRLRRAARVAGARRSSPATRRTRRSARPTSAPARPGSCCGRATSTRSPRRSPSRASRTCRWRCAAAGTASAAARPTTAASSSTSAGSNAIEVLDRRPARPPRARARAGATSRRRSRRTGWR